MEPKFKFKGSQFVKIYRKMLNWQWYDDVNTKVLFLHCLLRANWASGEWHGIHYDKGEFITSVPSLAEETGLTVSQVKTSLKHLISTGEITSRLTDKMTGKKITKCRIITINKWNDYQGNDRQKDSQATGKKNGKSPTDDRQVTADREYKENSENNKRIKKEKEPAALSSDEELAAERSSEEEYEEIDFGAMTDEEFERWMKEHGSRNL